MMLIKLNSLTYSTPQLHLLVHELKPHEIHDVLRVIALLFQPRTNLCFVSFNVMRVVKENTHLVSPSPYLTQPQSSPKHYQVM